MKLLIILTEKRETQTTWQYKHRCEQIFNYTSVITMTTNSQNPMKFKENGFNKNQKAVID